MTKSDKAALATCRDPVWKYGLRKVLPKWMEILR